MKTLRLLLSALAITSFFSFDSLAQTTWTLQSCINHAYEHNIQIKQSELGGERAQINHLGAVGSFLPSVNASASHGYNLGQVIDPFSNQFAGGGWEDRVRSNNLGMSTGLLLFNGFRNHLNLKRAVLGVDLAAANLEQTKNDIALSIAAAYLNILFQEEFIKLAKLNLETTERQVERVSKLVEAGASPAADLLDVKAQEASDIAALISSENARFLAKLNLVQMLQLEGSTAADFEVISPQISDLEVSPIPITAEAAVSYAMNNFPQIHAADLNVEDSELGLSIAKAGRMPRISGSYNFGTGYSGNRKQWDDNVIEYDYTVISQEGYDVSGTVFNYDNANQEVIPFGTQLTSNINQSIFFSMSVPIFNGFSVQNGVSQARINVLQSQYTKESTAQALRTSVESAWADALAAQKTLIAQEAALSSAELAFANTELRFEAGAVSALEYADARNRLDNAKINALRTRYDLVFKSKILDFYRGNAITL